MTYEGITELIEINPGNWTSDNNTEQTSILYQVQNAINEKFNTTLFRVEYINPSTGKIRITNSTFSTTTPVTSPLFSINFRVNDNSRAADFGLGYNLGFRESAYFDTNTINAEAILNIIDTNYLFLTLDPDWKVIEHETPDRTQVFSFAKIVIDQPKFAIVYDNQNELTKEYFLKQPTNIHSIPVRISDPYDQDIDLNGLDFSFTLELTEVLNSGLYESMRS